MSKGVFSSLSRIFPTKKALRTVSRNSERKTILHIPNKDNKPICGSPGDFYEVNPEEYPFPEWAQICKKCSKDWREDQ